MGVAARGRRSLWGLGGLLLVGGLLLHGWLGSGLVLAGWGLLVGLLAAPLRPVLGAQVHYRVRYHAPGAPVAVAQAGRQLMALAAIGGRVTLTWHRYSPTDLALYASLPSGVAGAFRTVAPLVWPGATLEPVGGLPAPAPLVRLYRVGDLSAAGEWAALVSAPEGPPVMWLHWQEAGGGLLVGVGPGQGRPRGGRGIPGGGGGGRLLVGRYWLGLTPWPRTGPPALVWPATDGPATATLDPHTTLILPPPATYTRPPGPAAVGQAVAGGVEVAPDQPGHGLILEPDPARRAAWVGYQVRQAVRAGWGLVVVDSETGVLDQIRAAAGVTWERQWIALDLRYDPPAARPGLLTAATPTPAAALAALGHHLSGTLALYLRYLGYLGLTPATLGGAAPLVPAWVGTLLIAHYRARVEGRPRPPLPEIPALYRAWGTPDQLAGLLAAEGAAWGTPTPAMEAAVTALGARGPQMLGQIRHLLGVFAASLATLPPTDRRMYTLSLRGRIAAVADDPILGAYWGGPQAGDTLLGASAQHPLLVTLPGSMGRPEQRRAGEWYGLYLLHLLEAVALQRATLDPAPPPVLIVWAGLGGGWTRLSGPAVTQWSARLGAGGLFVLGADSTLGGWPAPQAAALLGAWPSWVCGALDGPSGERVGAAYAPARLPAGWSWPALPPGLGLAHVPSATGPVVATIQLPGGVAAGGRRIGGVADVD